MVSREQQEAIQCGLCYYNSWMLLLSLGISFLNSRQEAVYLTYTESYVNVILHKLLTY